MPKLNKVDTYEGSLVVKENTTNPKSRIAKVLRAQIKFDPKNDGFVLRDNRGRTLDKNLPAVESIRELNDILAQEGRRFHADGGMRAENFVPASQN